MARTGTHTLDDLLAVRDQTVAEYGEDTIAEILQRDLELFNEQVQMMLMDLCEVTADRQRRYGTSVDGDMVDTDEFGSPAAQKGEAGATVGFPLFKKTRGVGWTRDYLLMATPADIATATIATQKAYLRAIYNQIRGAVFPSANYTFVDRFVDKVELAVKRLVNADGAAIPNGPNGEPFDGGTHTHYLATDGLTQSALLAAIDDLVEHDHGEGVRVYINKAEEQTVMGMAGFKAYVDPRIIYRQSDTPGETLDITRINNRAIGILGAAEVWVKPWIPAGYQLIFSSGEDEKPIAFRQHPVEAVRGLRLAAMLDEYPLRADIFEAYMGAGIWNRTAAVVHYSGGAVYVDPNV